MKKKLKLKNKEKPVDEEVESPSSNNEGILRHVSLALIVDHPDIPYRKLKPDHLAQLKKSIHRNGLDVPLDVWDGGNPKNRVEIKGIKGAHPATFLVAGMHRRTALQELQEEDKKWFERTFPDGIPVKVRTGKLEEAVGALIRENVDRDNPDPSELLPQVRFLSKKRKLKNVEIARLVGKSKAWVGTILDIHNQLGDKVEQDVIDKKIGLSDAVSAAQKAKRTKKKGGKVDQEKIHKKLSKKGSSKKKGRAPKRLSPAVLYKRYHALPNMSTAKRLPIAESIIAYVAGESDDLPSQIATTDEE